MLKPAPPGTGVIAGGSVRAVVELAGVKDIVTKVRRSTNPVNVVKAAHEALSLLRDPQEEIRRRRGGVSAAETTDPAPAETVAADTADPAPAETVPADTTPTEA